MNWLIGVMLVPLGLLFLWAFSAVMICAVVGLLVSALLWQPVRFWRRRQLLAEAAMNPAFHLQEQAQNHSALFYMLAALVVWTGCAAMLGTLLLLPQRMYAPEQLVLASGIAFVVALANLIKLVGNLRSVGKEPAEARDAKDMASLAAGIVPMLCVVVLIFFVPNTAGWMVWREEWRGYASTQLRVPLKVNDAQHQKALLDLVQPLLTQGSRIVSNNTRSKNGSSYTQLAALPARYRFHDDALEIQLAGEMDSRKLQLHQETLDMVARDEQIDPSLLAYAQCMPSLEKMGRSRMLSQGRSLMRELQTCVQTRAAATGELMQRLAGSLEPVQTQQNWFNPMWSLWRKGEIWHAVSLPEGDELENLDALR